VSAAGGALGAGEGYAIEQVDVALGSNVEDRATHLAAARAAIGHLPRTRIVATSTVEETAPVGPAGQGPYLNQMLRLATALAPRELLDRLLAVEAAAGRARDPARRWGPRTLDCDIVRFGARTIDEPGLTVPHPELPNRDWWLRELAELDALLGAGAPEASNAALPRGAAP
jgi:2-amino-4-hydroxy-6-hydroxymethyldihydropteridine diphosphokinase